MTRSHPALALLALVVGCTCSTGLVANDPSVVTRCHANSHFVDGQCVAAVPPEKEVVTSPSLCAPATLRCEGNALQTCDDGEAWRTLRECSCGCTPGPDGPRCLTVSCQPGQLSCRDGSVQRCADSGCHWDVTERCSVGCDAASTRCRACDPAEQRCLDPTTLSVCDESGNEWLSQSCEHGCDTQQNRCRLCAAGSRRCNGDHRETCNADGLSWRSTPCPHGCGDDECLPPKELHPPVRLSAGFSHTCAINSEQRLHCWGRRGTRRQIGDDDARWLTLPKSNPECGIQLDGSLWCWKVIWDSGAPLAAHLVDTGPWRSLAADDNGVTCAVATSGGLACFTIPYKFGAEITLNPVGPAEAKWLTAAVGYREVCAIADDGETNVGELHCWARANGSLFQLKDQNSTVITLGLGQFRWRDVAIGTGLRCAVRDAGRLFCWGTLSGLGNIPVGPTAGWDSFWWRVSVSNLHLCALRTDGSAACLGRNWEGQLGNAHFGSDQQLMRDLTLPTLLSGTYWSSISAGRTHSCGVRDDGSFWCWGDNGESQISSAPLKGQPTPLLTPYSKPAMKLFAGDSMGCIIDAAQRLHCWGLLAGDTGLHYPKPTPLTATRWQTLAMRSEHLCGIDDAQRLWCWGDNTHGQLGIGNTEAQQSPHLVGDQLWRSVAVGMTHTCGVQQDGSLWCWGKNVSLGLTVGTNRLPQRIGGDSDWRHVASAEHDCGLKADHTLWCWGDNTRGQLGLGDTALRVVPTQVGNKSWREVVINTSRSCAIDLDGALYCWGLHAFVYNDLGQMVGSLGAIDTTALQTVQSGNSVATFASTPLHVAGGPYLSISVARSHTCALSSDGQLNCWGQDYPSPGKIGSGLSAYQWKAVVAGGTFSCGLDNAGNLRCWGSNTLCQLGVGPCENYPLATAVPGAL